jgi:hypothetical protein
MMMRDRAYHCCIRRFVFADVDARALAARTIIACMRPLSPSFVVTATALAASASVGCPKDAPRDRIAGDDTAATASGKATDKAKPNPTASDVAKKEFRKRKNSGTAGEWKEAGKVDWTALTILNPISEKGRRIMIGGPAGDSCFVDVDSEEPLPPGGRKLGQIDCPPELDEPAWDTCLMGDLAKQKDGSCVCLQSGNPPPPPSMASCPKGKVKP